MRFRRDPQMSEKMRGYSLVEFLVSMSTALVLTATSLPSVTKTLNTYSLRNDARRLVAQCQNARFQAISSNVPYRLHVNGTSVELQKLSGGAYTAVGSFPLSPSTRIASTWSSDPVFSPRGTANPAVSITLANNLIAQQNTVSVSVLGVVTLQ